MKTTLKEATYDFKSRIMTSAICFLCLALILFLAPYPYFKPIFTLIVGVICTAALGEYFSLLRSKKIKASPAAPFAATFLYLFALFFTWQEGATSLLPFTVLMLLGFYLFISHFFRQEQALLSISASFFGFCYITLPLALWVPIIYFFQDPLLGQLSLCYLLIVTKFNDIGALFGGRFFGKHKLLSSISPKKTVEGAISGTLSAVLVSLLFSFFFDLFPLSTALWLAILLSLFAHLGDFAESLLKRDGKIKDSGRHIPGLGGILDLVDSLIFTTPLFYLFLQLFYGELNT